jgi:NADH-quinone oxidoreductase subunit C
MSDTDKTPPGDPKTPEETPPETPEPAAKTDETAADSTAAREDSPKTPPAAPDAPKPKLTDEEKAAKIAAAKAKAAAAKAAKEGEAEQPPKPPWEEKPVTPEHEDASADPDVTALAAAVEGAVLAADRFAGDVTVTVPADGIIEICRYLKTERGFSFLVDLTAVDWPEREGARFDVVYWMHRFDDSKRLRLVAAIPEDRPIASATSIWRTADWLEREVYDMFGILFEDHPALERILTWEGFNGHPLRKDFPVEGIDTGAAIYPDVYPPGGGPLRPEELEPPPPAKEADTGGDA